MIAVYVQAKYAKATYSNESFNARHWSGVAMLEDVLVRAGEKVDYVGSATVSNVDILLVSITSGCDWWSYIAEAKTWKHKPRCVIVGGAGLLNVRPVLRWFDVCVWGRGEDIILPLIEAIRCGKRYDHPSVGYSDTFSESNQYQIAQAVRLYPHAVTLQGSAVQKGRTIYVEKGLGCKRKCAFCAYTHHRKHLASAGGRSYEQGGGEDREVTMLDLDMKQPETWGADKLRNVGLDGMSERVRMMVRKPIKRKLFQDFLVGLSRSGCKPHQVKLYCVVGFPDETLDDWMEHLEDLAIADAAIKESDKQWSWVLGATPFRAMPATPAATWPMSIKNYRGEIARALKCKGMPGNVYFQGKRSWAVEWMGTDSLPSGLLDALILRGTQGDAEIISKLATSKAFWSASSTRKRITIASTCDLKRLMGDYRGKSDYPVSYLKTYSDKIFKTGVHDE